MDKKRNSYTRIWFMRQAGRYLPEYRKLRQKKKTFLDLCFDPKLATEISLQPIKRFDLDFIILFSDILVIPYALGQDVTFKENIGPILNPITGSNELNYKDSKTCLKKLEPVFETINRLNQRKKDKQLIGFCGAPFTVLTYMIQGKSSKTHNFIKKEIRLRRKEMLEIVKVLIDISVKYLSEQIKRGADYVMIFDSWSGVLKEDDYELFVTLPNKAISDSISNLFPKIKKIFFPRGSNREIFNFINKVNCDVLSVDSYVPQKLLKEAKEKNIILQGNLDPKLLVQGGKKLDSEIYKIMTKFKNNKHIFNLSHGIQPNTPIENVEKVIQMVREYEAS